MSRIREHCIIIAVLLMLLASSAYAEEKKVQLLINDEDADEQSNAVTVMGPGTFTLTGKVVNNIKIEESKKKMDIVFILDASGSMQGEIDAVRDSIKRIIDEVNSAHPNLLRFGIYVFEGHGSNKTGFTSKNYGCDTDDDVGAIHLTANGGLLKNRLDQINASCGLEPWAYLTYAVISDSSFGWRGDAVKGIIVISDEPADCCHGECDCYYCSEAAATIESKNAYFFGIYSDIAKRDMEKMKNKLGKRAYVTKYTDTSQIPKKIENIIHYLLAQDDFTVSSEVSNPAAEDWDNISGNFPVPEVEREGGYRKFSIVLDIPPIPDPSLREVFFKYTLKVVGQPELKDDAWLRVISGKPPQANINVINYPVSGGVVTGQVPISLEVNAEGTTDPENDIKELKWDCEKDGTIDATVDCGANPNCLSEIVTCDTYTIKNHTYTLKLAVIDSTHQEGTAELVVQTNPNIPPNVSLSIPSEIGPLEDANMVANATDADGKIIRYYWDFGDGSTFDCDVAASPTPCDQVTHQYSAKGIYSVTVTVYDNDLDVSSASAQIKVKNRPPSKPKIFAQPTSGLVPLSVDLFVSNAENLDPDGDAVYFRWDFGDGTIIETNNPFAKHTYSTPNRTYNVTCKAIDVENAESEASDAVQISTIKISGITDFYAKDTNINEKTEVKGTCTGMANMLEIKIYQGGNLVYTAPNPIPCDNTFHEIGYVFPEADVYLVEATVQNMGAIPNCTNCIQGQYIQVKEPFPELQTPETHPILVLIAGVLILTLIRRGKV